MKLHSLNESILIPLLLASLYSEPSMGFKTLFIEFKEISAFNTACIIAEFGQCAFINLKTINF